MTDDVKTGPTPAIEEVSGYLPIQRPNAIPPLDTARNDHHIFRRAHESTSQPFQFDWLGWVGVVLLLVQGAAMLAWSTLLWRRYALTYDYAAYHQAWWLIAHGNLNPFDTVLRFPFWQNNLELIMWPLAIIGAIYPHGPVLLWVQDAGVVVAEIVVWKWMQEYTFRHFKRHVREVAFVGIILLLADPWTWSSISFDFHIELVALPLVVLAAYDLDHGHRRAAIWVVLTLLCGDAEATWVAGLGLATLLLAAPHRWRRGLTLIAAGLTWVVAVTVIHGDKGGDVVGFYGYLAGASARRPTLESIILGVITHPQRALSTLNAHRVDIWANLAPQGLIGVVTPWALGLAVPVLLADELLPGLNFAAPIFQSVLLYVMVPLGTIMVLVWVHRRSAWVYRTVGAVLIANALIWTATWLPTVPTTWLRVTPSAAAVLAHADAMIPPSAEVIASQGVVGRFSDRHWVYPLFPPPQTIPIRTTNTWWIVAPSAGIELQPITDADALIAELAEKRHVVLLLQHSNIWVFHWITPPGLHSISLPVTPTTLQAWSFPGEAGEAILDGPPGTWHVSSVGRKGYVVSGDYWREKRGLYTVTVTLATTIAADIEVWNATGNILVSRRALAATTGRETVSMSFRLSRLYPHRLFQGWGPFQIRATPTPPGNRLEVRVWSPGGGIVDIISVRFQQISNNTYR